MELALTIIAWLAGIFAFFILTMAIIFSETAHTTTTADKIISPVATFLILYLLYLGISSLFFSSSALIPELTSNQVDIGLWVFYIILLVSFFGWIFTPSKNKSSKTKSIKMKILGCMTLEKDEAGLQAWDPKWEPKVKEESDK
jgi:protein-S-isoprenylcysteine O-methyltransferase Ste14